MVLLTVRVAGVAVGGGESDAIQGAFLKLRFDHPSKRQHIRCKSKLLPICEEEDTTTAFLDQHAFELEEKHGEMVFKLFVLQHAAEENSHQEVFAARAALSVHDMDAHSSHWLSFQLVPDSPLIAPPRAKFAFEFDTQRASESESDAGRFSRFTRRARKSRIARDDKEVVPLSPPAAQAGGDNNNNNNNNPPITSVSSVQTLLALQQIEQNRDTRHLQKPAGSLSLRRMRSLSTRKTKVNNSTFTMKEFLNTPTADGADQDSDVDSEEGFDERDVQEHRKRKVLSELLDTEERYVDGLLTVIHEFLLPLKSGKVLPSQQLKTIFVNIEEMASFHTDLLNRLRNTPAPADVFLSVAERMQELYSQFVHGYSSSVRLVDSLAEQKKIRTLLSERKRGQTLESYLITPIQRIPRYILLLEQLRRFSDADSDVAAQLALAVQKLNAVTEEVNEVRRETDREEHVQSMLLRSMDIPGKQGDILNGAVPPSILSIQSKVTDLPEPLAVKGRRVLCVGKLRILVDHVIHKSKKKFLRSHHGVTWKSHLFYLFNDLLLWTNKQHRYKGSVDLTTVVLHRFSPSSNVSLDDDMDTACAFTLKGKRKPMDRKIVILNIMTTSPEECVAWKSKITSAAAERRVQSGAQPVETDPSISPQWVEPIFQDFFINLPTHTPVPTSPTPIPTSPSTFLHTAAAGMSLPDFTRPFMRSSVSAAPVSASLAASGASFPPRSPLAPVAAGSHQERSMSAYFDLLQGLLGVGQRDQEVVQLLELAKVQWLAHERKTEEQKAKRRQQLQEQLNREMDLFERQKHAAVETFQRDMRMASGRLQKAFDGYRELMLELETGVASPLDERPIVQGSTHNTVTSNGSSSVRHRSINSRDSHSGGKSARPSLSSVFRLASNSASSSRPTPLSPSPSPLPYSSNSSSFPSPSSQQPLQRSSVSVSSPQAQPQSPLEQYLDTPMEMESPPSSMSVSVSVDRVADLVPVAHSMPPSPELSFDNGTIDDIDDDIDI